MEATVEDFFHPNRFAVLADLDDQPLFLERKRATTYEEKERTRVERRARQRQHRKERQTQEAKPKNEEL